MKGKNDRFCSPARRILAAALCLLVAAALLPLVSTGVRAESSPDNYCEVLDSDGTLTFVRTTDTVETQGNGTVTDIHGNTYTGFIFAKPKDDGSLPQWWNMSEIKKINIPDPIRSGKSVSRWFSDLSQLEEINGLSNLDTSQATDFSYMFADSPKLSNLDLSGLNTSNATNMLGMFEYDTGLTSLDLSGFDMSHVTQMNEMFLNCSGLQTVKLGSPDTSSVTKMNWMFLNCTSLQSIEGLDQLDTQNVTDFSDMFGNCKSLLSLDVSRFDTGSATNMTEMFAGCESLPAVDVSHFDTSNVTEMQNMFADCKLFSDVDVSGFDTSNVVNMSAMFMNCTNLTSLDLSNFDTRKVRYFQAMFRGCTSLTSVDVSSFNTEKGERFGEMFQDCAALKSLDLRSFSVDEGDNVVNMFYGTCADNNTGTPIAGLAFNQAQADLFNNSRTDGINLAKLKFNPGVLVTFESNGGSAVAAQSLLPGTRAKKPEDPTRSGYLFAGWYSDEALSMEFSFDTELTEDTTLYAKWTKAPEKPAARKPRAPKTGDASEAGLYLLVLAASGAALASCAVLRRKRG